MDSFSPLPATAGGILIGLASALLWLGNGRIAGISGIFGQLLPASSDWLWRAIFIASLAIGAIVAAWLIPGIGVGGPGGTPAVLAAAPPGWNVPQVAWQAGAGLLTGLGTRLANGCTSGHGICGLARLSTRSFVAVGIFFSVAIATVAITGIV